MQKKQKFILLTISVFLISIFACERNDIFEESLKARQNIPLMNIYINKTSTSIETGKTEQLYVIYEPADASNKKVIWASDNQTVAPVSQDGTVSAMAQGSAKITAVSDEGTFMAECFVSVSTWPVPLSGINLDCSSHNIYVGGTYPLSVIYYPSNATNQSVIWSSSNTSIADVTAAGVVHGISAGTAIITATSQEGGFTGICEITVSNVAVMGVLINPSTHTMSAGETVQLLADIAPANATNREVMWKSLDPKIAAVDTSGLVTALMAGSTDIEVTTIDGGKSAVCNITINR